ncbi:hypothetical protein NUM_23110 [Actinocatenispora comari]|uniref:Uncharacterized protein n=2 Tax=Actinocatenispora comari TaxID=2807577 RepID=A0A8J4AC87_9ACTN|nr:hypothetical protein NUM_23110 [Actinocatenispora comari]
MVFEKANSEILGARNLVAHDALRALGVGTDILKRTTKLLPEFSLESVDRTLCRSFKSDGVWNFWGNSDAARRAFESRNTAPKISPDDRLAHEVDNFITDIAVELTIARYLGVMRQRYAELRDFSRERHGKFNARQIARLRKDVLTLSLDLGSVSRDVERVGSSALRDEDGAYFQIRYAFDSPRIFEPTKSLIREVRTGQLVSARELAAADREYREILGAVVSLGSSIDAMRTGRLALLVAAVSLVVAFLTFLITGPGDNAPAETLWRLLASWAFNGSG